MLIKKQRRGAFRQSEHIAFIHPAGCDLDYFVNLCNVQPEFFQRDSTGNYLQHLLLKAAGIRDKGHMPPATAPAHYWRYAAFL